MSSAAAADNAGRLAGRVLNKAQPYVRTQVAARALAAKREAPVAQVRALFERALEEHAAHEMASVDSQFVPDTLNHLAVAEAQRGETRDALRHLYAAVRAGRDRGAYGEASKEVAAFRANLAATLCAGGMQRKAAAVLREVLTAADAGAGRADEEAWAGRRLAALYDLASTLNDLALFPEAAPVAERLVALHRAREEKHGRRGGAPADFTMALVLRAVIVSAPELGGYDEADALLDEATARAAEGLVGPGASGLGASLDTIRKRVARARAASGGRAVPPSEAVLAARRRNALLRPCHALMCPKLGSLRCGQCRAVYFCSKECQRGAWKSEGHKEECSAPAAAE